jgi:hypothetical protein
MNPDARAGSFDGKVDRDEAERCAELALSSGATKRLLATGLLAATARFGVGLAHSSHERAGSTQRALAELTSGWDLLIEWLAGTHKAHVFDQLCLDVAGWALAVSLLAGADEWAGEDGMPQVGCLAIQAIGVVNSPQEMEMLRLAPHSRLAADCERAGQLLAPVDRPLLADCAVRASARAQVLALDWRERSRQDPWPGRPTAGPGA